MPKPKWNLNIIYISERLQESLRPISRCAMTTVVAPMGYGKTTAVNWYLGERARAEPLHSIRISVYSDNLAIFWKSAQEAFARAGFPFLREYPCPTDAAGGGLLIDDLCHALAGETACYLFIDDFHLLTDKRASLFLCMLAGIALSVLISRMPRSYYLGNIPAMILSAACALALLIGFAYLLIRGVISWHTPVCFVGTVFVMSLILGQDAVGQILSGGLMLGAIFMATDYSTTPSTVWGRVLFGIGAGLLTVLIRFYGAYAEGVSFAILFMNILTPYLSRWTETKPFGGVAA